MVESKQVDAWACDSLVADVYASLVCECVCARACVRGRRVCGEGATGVIAFTDQSAATVRMVSLVSSVPVVVADAFVVAACPLNPSFFG